MVKSKLYFIGFYVSDNMTSSHLIKSSNKAHSLQTSTNIVLSSYFNCFVNFYNVNIFLCKKLWIATHKGNNNP